MQRIVGIDGMARRPIVDRQRPDRPSADLSGRARADLRIADPPREEQRDRRLEIAGVLQEERSLLGKEHFEALVDGDLRLVGFHLAEIGIDREVERHRIVRDDLRVDAGARGGIALEDRPVEEPRTSERPIGNELDVVSWRDALKTVPVRELVRES